MKHHTLKRSVLVWQTCPREGKSQSFNLLLMTGSMPLKLIFGREEDKKVKVVLSYHMSAVVLAIT